MKVWKTHPTQTAITTVVVTVLALLIIIAAAQEENGTKTTGSATAVTIIVVDDFSNSLSRLAAELPDAPFERAVANVREVLPYGPEQQDARQQGPDEELLVELRQIVDELSKRLDNEPVSRLSTILERPIEETDCAITSEGTAFFHTDGTAFFATDGTAFFHTDGTGHAGAAHGVRVQKLVESLLGTYAGNADITVDHVDTAGFDIAVVVDRLAAKIAAIRKADPDRHIVVNMSFAVIPCKAVPSLMVYDRLMGEFAPTLDEDLDTLRALFAALVSTETFRVPQVGEGTFDATFCTEAVERYPAAKALCQSSEEKAQVVLVGASGNGVYHDGTGLTVGQDFPFFPAAWGEVIAVSASDSPKDFISLPPRASYSNAATVLMPGVWQVTRDYAEVGTSFAAPRYSVLVALNLARVKNQDIGCGMGVIPGPVKPHDWLNNPPPVSAQDIPPC